jgi:hypothetical protein
MCDREFVDTSQPSNTNPPMPIVNEYAQSSVYEVNEEEKVHDNGEYSIDRCSVITTYMEDGVSKHVDPYLIYRTHFKGMFLNFIVILKVFFIN